MFHYIRIENIHTSQVSFFDEIELIMLIYNSANGTLHILHTLMITLIIRNTYYVTICFMNYDNINMTSKTKSVSHLSYK